jgi:lipoprotein-releasing system ATP-binding protein
MQPLLQALKIHKRFQYPKDQTVIKEVSLAVYPSDTIAILGASGQGKSTLLHMLGTLEPLSSGSITILNTLVDTKNAPTLRNRHIGFVFQAFHLLENYSALENALMPAKIAGMDTSKNTKVYKRLTDLFEKLELKERLHFKTNLLSGGEKQRVSIARALCMDPSIIFADEPSGNLDHNTAKHIHNILLDLSQKENKALILVTHNLELASLCKKKYTLQNGYLED